MGELLGLITFNQEKQVEVDLSDEHLSTLKAQFARSQDSHFDALGTHMVTHPKNYKTNLAQIQAEFGVDSIYGTHSFRHRELCAQIVRLATESIAFLTDRKRRVTYRQERFDKTMLRQAADVLLEKADMNRLRGDLEAMRDALEMALELDPVLTREHIRNQKTKMRARRIAQLERHPPMSYINALSRQSDEEDKMRQLLILLTGIF